MPKKAYKNEIRLSATVALITVLFVIAWLPLFVVSVMATYHPQQLPSPLGIDRVLKFVKFCHYSNSALNPFVYAYRNRDMIKTFRYIAYKLLCRESKLQIPLVGPSTSLVGSASYRNICQGSSRNGKAEENNRKAESFVRISRV